MTFTQPEYFYLLLLLIPAIAFYVWKYKKSHATLQVPSVGAFAKLPRSWKVYLQHFNFFLLLCAFSAIVAVLARPQSSDNWSTSSTEGIEIVIALDVSGSMEASDFKPNRLESAKDVAAKFVNGRPADNIGMVVFGRESYTLCPMTTDRAALANMIESLKFGMVDGDGTAIGDGLVTAINRIRKGKAKSKVIILLTDGVNNSGDVAPNDAAKIAEDENIRVYTIGIGTVMRDGTYTFDEPTLRNIARITGGRYFHADNGKKLTEIFGEIEQMEKTELSVREFSKHEEEFLPYALAAIAFLLLHLLLRNSVLRNLP